MLKMSPLWRNLITEGKEVLKTQNPLFIKSNNTRHFAPTLSNDKSNLLNGFPNNRLCHQD